MGKAVKMTSDKVDQAMRMLLNGKKIVEIAHAMGVSTTTIHEYIGNRRVSFTCLTGGGVDQIKASMEHDLIGRWRKKCVKIY